MIRLIFSSLTFTNTIHASYYRMEEKLQMLTKNESSINRNLADFIPTTLNNLANYGCWCFPTAGNYGKGPAQDSFDTLCRSLSDGYDCAIQDAQLRGEVCVPNEIEYDDPNIGGNLNALPSTANSDIKDILHFS